MFDDNAVKGELCEGGLSELTFVKNATSVERGSCNKEATGATNIMLQNGDPPFFPTLSTCLAQQKPSGA